MISFQEELTVCAWCLGAKQVRLCENILAHSRSMGERRVVAIDVMKTRNLATTNTTNDGLVLAIVAALPSATGTSSKHRELANIIMPVLADDHVPPPATITSYQIAHHPGPGHDLKQVPLLFCDGCLEPVAGIKCRCEREGCSFNLHAYCGTAPETLSHPVFGDRVFLFLREPPRPEPAHEGHGGSRTCVACGEAVLGFVYHCFADDDDLHPCCAHLDGSVDFGHGKEGSSSSAKWQRAQPPEVHGIELHRQEAPRSGETDTAGDRNRNRGQQRRPGPAVSRYRQPPWWKG